MEEVITVVLGGRYFSKHDSPVSLKSDTSLCPPVKLRWSAFSLNTDGNNLAYFSKHDSPVSLKSDTSLRPPVKLRWSAFSLNTDGNNLAR
jgi:hypothetical protein